MDFIESIAFMADIFSLEIYTKRPRRIIDKDTESIGGCLFLAPDLQKIWLSHYDVKLLKKVSSS